MAFVVTVAQRKGGAGKSTVAATLATSLAAQGQRVALLDSDPQQSLARWHGLRAGQAQARPLDFAAVSGWRMPATLEQLRGTHDSLVIDTPPHADSDARIAIRAADLVLVPLQPSAADLWAMEATLAVAAEEKRLVRLLLNRVPPQGRLREEIVAELRRRGLPLLDYGFGNRADFASAFARGLGVAEAAPRGSAAAEARAVLRAIEESLASPTP
ncbi:ParA family partition ATPase [Teichococcus cervicalis]|uniref:CobQ/CobB/MinD/ParA nucleotide binding domain protein n=1 Tax=Pseudoroseomonas cervicalis ATCC 49957 TaxID=525371 RepID=D5RP32_9PROT|nr:ParA family partition ATPase [Pseudoroseomonas cervicalis]EFH10937.1 CobQ/CobB/MinD/ParA nucleotide binding domain protein [Pseudoroseomonas cervicalis ATCC 49957]